MNDFHWWMGLAPLLGFLLDALLGGTRLDELVESWVGRALPRTAFIVRNAFGGPSRVAGYALVLWLGATALVVAWGLGVLGYVIYREYGLFLVRTVIFLLLFTARRLTARGIESLVLVSSGDLPGARATLRQLGPAELADDPDALCADTVSQLSSATLSASLIPLFWGVVGGSTAAAAALVVHIVALQRPEGADGDQPMWDAVARVDQWVSTPAAWIGGIVYPAVIGLVGGRRNAALAAFFGSPKMPAGARLAAMVTRGVGLRPREGDGRLVASGADVQKVVQLLFLGGFLCALFASGVSALLHHVI